MLALNFYEISEIVIGLIIIWVSVYLVSRNPSSWLSWTTFVFLFGFSFSTFTDPILLHSRSLHEYVVWQKFTNWPFFIAPIAYYHASLLVSGVKNKKRNIILVIGYIISVALYGVALHGGVFLKEDIIRFSNYQRFDGFAPGPLLVPTVLFVWWCFFMGTLNFWHESRKNLKKYFLPILSGAVYTIASIFTLISYYVLIPPAGIIFMVAITLGALLFTYSMVRYHLFLPSEKIIFDNSFFYKSIVVAFILLIYIGALFGSRVTMNFEILVFLSLMIMLVIFTHSFYDWFGTFINDVVYNLSSGLSVVSDEEVYQALKFFNVHERLENSSLLRLNVVQNGIKKNALSPVDSLRELLKNSIKYFKPESESNRRVKSKLKYHLLKMLVFDEAEEGQILWELGFDEYPVRIMSRENNLRKPLFEVKSPSDYTYTSRNAYLALKKEAIHDVTWRISYLEKLAKKKLF
ncbi:MAG: hypothetical protein WC536_04330 [Patescibacteria group bacterium]